MKINLQITKIEEKKNLVYFKLNEEDYYFNIKTEFIYKADNKNKYSYVSNFDSKIKNIIKVQYQSYKKYNNKIKEH